MTELESTYRAFLANPLDRTPRMVYADLLEDLGRRRRAEYFRNEWTPHRSLTWSEWITFEASLYWHPDQEIFCPKCRHTPFIPCPACESSKSPGFIPRPFPRTFIEFAEPITELFVPKRPEISTSPEPQRRRYRITVLTPGRLEMCRPVYVTDDDLWAYHYARSTTILRTRSGVFIDRLAKLHWPGIEVLWPGRDIDMVASLPKNPPSDFALPHG